MNKSPSSNSAHAAAWIAAIGAMLAGIAAAVALLREATILGSVLAGVFVGLAIIVVYYFTTLRRMFAVLGGSKIQLTTRTISVQENLPRGKSRTHVVGELALPNERTGVTDLNWITVLEGFQRITKWVGDRVRPTLYVGINPAGVMMASYIRGVLMHDAPLATYLTPPGGPRPSSPARLVGIPDASIIGPGPVLLVDSKIMGGQTATGAAKKILDHLGEKTELWLVCLVACGIDTDRVSDRASIPIESLFTPGGVNEYYDSPNRIVPTGIAYVARKLVQFPDDLR